MNLEGKRVFLSGPMTGIEHNNIAQFAVAHAIAYEHGASQVYNPAQVWVNERAEIAEDKTHEAYMLDCVHELTRRDFAGDPYYSLLVSLPEWWTSDGAQHERDVAKHCGIECINMYDIYLEEDAS